jgi:hypothetical protein
MTFPTLAEPRNHLAHSNGKCGHDDGGCNCHCRLGFTLER